MGIAIHLIHRKCDDSWHLEQDGFSVGAFNTKADAVVAGQLRARRMGAFAIEVRLITYGADGSIDMEYQYGEASRQPIFISNT